MNAFPIAEYDQGIASADDELECLARVVTRLQLESGKSEHQAITDLIAVMMTWSQGKLVMLVATAALEKSRELT